MPLDRPSRIRSARCCVEESPIKQLTIAAYQGPPIIGDPPKALELMLSVYAKAKQQEAEILLFPECFLHSYFANVDDARKHSLDLQSQEFVDICAKFDSGRTVVVFGLNERANGNIFNTAVIVTDGTCQGMMRKTVTYAPYDYYGLGTAFPVFETSGIKFGICICADTTYFEPSRILALNGAQLLLCPCYNKISRRHRLLPHMQNKNHIIARAVENHVWLVCSDVVCSEPNDISFGCSCVIDPYGNIAAQAPVLTETLLVYNIPLQSLDPARQPFDRQRQENRFLRANAGQFEQMVEAYYQRFGKAHSKQAGTS